MHEELPTPSTRATKRPLENTTGDQPTPRTRIPACLILKKYVVVTARRDPLLFAFWFFSGSHFCSDFSQTSLADSSFLCLRVFGERDIQDAITELYRGVGKLNFRNKRMLFPHHTLKFNWHSFRISIIIPRLHIITQVEPMWASYSAWRLPPHSRRSPLALFLVYFLRSFMLIWPPDLYHRRGNSEGDKRKGKRREDVLELDLHTYSWRNWRKPPVLAN